MNPLYKNHFIKRVHFMDEYFVKEEEEEINIIYKTHCKG